MPLNTLKDALEPLMPAAVVALMGGMVRFLMGKGHSFFALLRGLAASFFAGIIAALFLADMALSFETKMGIAGMFGFAAELSLNWLLKFAMRRASGGALPLDMAQNKPDKKG